MLFQDSDWEELQTGDIENDQEFLSSVSAAASGKPTYEHLEAIAKVFNEVCLTYNYAIMSSHIFPLHWSFFHIGDCLLNLLENHKDQEDQYEDDLLSVADPLNQVSALDCVSYVVLYKIASFFFNFSTILISPNRSIWQATSRIFLLTCIRVTGNFLITFARCLIKHSKLFSVSLTDCIIGECYWTCAM